MPKAKSARLSLTLPGPLDANGQAAKDSTTVRRNSYDKVSSVASTGTADMSERQASRGRNGAVTPEFDEDLPAEPRSPQLTSLPTMPSSPGTSTHSRGQSGSIFSNMRAAKSSAKIPGSDPSSRAGSASTSIHEGAQKPEGRKHPLAGLAIGAGGASSQEEVRSPVNENSETSVENPQQHGSALANNTVRMHGLHNSSSLSAIPSYDQQQQQAARNKARGFNFMRRLPSHQSDDLRDDSAIREMKPQSRDRSGQASTPRTQPSPSYNPLAANDPQHLVSQKSGFFKALKTGANKTMLGMKKQRDKLTKSGTKPTIMTPSTPRANPDYQYRTLYAPLIDQVRLTRIAPRLEMSRDKTEFWLPALPWRCIDYLNYKGVEEEGIYRHPGALQHVNYYKQKFDREGDVNLYDEEDLYDVNVIASLLKAWLRDLPEPIFPHHLQSKLGETDIDSPHAPEELKQIIAKLAPWQYYLLFAITCHLSLIAGSADKNKMRVDNLFTCIGSQALKIDAHIFNWLVGDWRNCWMGCTDEKAYLEQEYAYLDEKEREAAEEPHPPLSSSSRGYPDSAYGSLGNQHVSSPLARPNASRPYTDNDGRPGSSRSQGNLRPATSYQLSHPTETAYDSTASSANSSGPTSARTTGTRKPSQTDMARSATDQRNQIQVQQNHQPRAPSPLGRRGKQEAGNNSRERSPTGRRPVRSETNTDGSELDARAASRRRAQSQPRSESSRGKSPSSQGRRRRGDTTSGSPAARSPSQGSDQFPDKNASGRRRREGSDAPEMPTLQKEQRQRYEQFGGSNAQSRKGSEVTMQTGSAAETPRRYEKMREEVGSDTPKDSREREPASGLEQLDLKEQKTSAGGSHERKGSKFRLSEQTFPEPISPTWKGA